MAPPGRAIDDALRALLRDRHLEAPRRFLCELFRMSTWHELTPRFVAALVVLPATERALAAEDVVLAHLDSRMRDKPYEPLMAQVRAVFTSGAVCAEALIRHDEDVKNADFSKSGVSSGLGAIAQRWCSDLVSPRVSKLLRVLKFLQARDVLTLQRGVLARVDDDGTQTKLVAHAERVLEAARARLPNHAGLRAACEGDLP